MVWQSGAEATSPEVKLHIAMSVRMFDGCKVLARYDDQSGFLTAFPNRTGSRRFARFALSAGKLSEPGKWSTFRSPTDQNATSGFNDGDSDADAGSHKAIL